MSYIVGEVLMVRLIRRYEDREYRTEAKQVGTLYHVCTLDAFANRIIEDKELGTKNNLHSSGKYWNGLLKTYNAVSFTRDKLFVVPTDEIRESNILFQIVVDGDKLSNKYKIIPYQDLISVDYPKLSQKEEVVIGPITNFKSYIKEVHFDIKDLETLFNNSNSLIYNLKQVIEYLGTIKCTRVNLPYSDNYGNLKFKYSSHTFKINTLEELIDKITTKNNTIGYIDTTDLLEKYLDTHNRSISSDLDLLYKDNSKFFTKSICNLLLTKSEDINVIKFCLEHGADVNIKDKYMCTPLNTACLRNNTELARLLLEHDADVNIKDKNNREPLYWACLYNNIELAKLLLDHGSGRDLDINNLPDYITKNKQIEDLVLSYLNKNKGRNESIKIRRLYRL